jgi:maltose alpha-D-glucosyltransferase/alpha-amylase
MGDNIWLGDRDSVRTPMQWTPERAGLSTADPGRLTRQPVMGSVYGYQAVNVEAQLDNSSSLLHWTPLLLHGRRRHPALRHGDYSDIGGSNSAVLAFTRTTAGETIICINNLSTYAESTQLDLSAWAGLHLTDVHGGHTFPAVGDLPYLITPGYSFLWMEVSSDFSGVTAGRTASPAPPIAGARFG